jgi:hypothetical protein
MAQQSFDEEFWLEVRIPHGLLLGLQDNSMLE